MTKLSALMISVLTLGSTVGYGQTDAAKGFSIQDSFLSDLDVTAVAFGVDWNFADPTIKNIKELPQACKDVNLTPEQKKATRDTMLDFLREMVGIKAEIVVTHIDYFKLLMDTGSSRTDADSLTTKGSEAIGRAASSIGQFANTVLFTILTPVQRESAIECGMLVLEAKMKEKMDRACSNRPRP